MSQAFSTPDSECESTMNFSGQRLTTNRNNHRAGPQRTAHWFSDGSQTLCRAKTMPSPSQRLHCTEENGQLKTNTKQFPRGEKLFSSKGKMKRIYRYSTEE